MTYEVSGLTAENLRYINNSFPLATLERMDALSTNITIPDEDDDELTDYLEDCDFEFRMV